MQTTMRELEPLILDQLDPQELAQALLNRYYTTLHYLAYSILGDADEADDIVQETLLTAVRKIDSYERGTNLRAWLVRITTNRCRDTIRWRKIREKWYCVWFRVASIGSPPRSPEQQMANKQMKDNLWLAVDELGEKHRLPIILHFLHDMTAREIAETLGIREGTVYSRLHYACRKLSGLLSEKECEAWAQELLNE